MIYLERQSLIFIQYRERYSGLQRKLREHSDSFKDDSDSSGETPSTQRNLQEGFQKVTEALARLQSLSKSSLRRHKHCFLVMVTKSEFS